MKEIEIGEYVRTKDGIIAQIKSIDYEAGIYRFDRIIYNNDFGMKEDVLYNNEMFKKVIVKHSKQLIDLIEIGDIVNEFLVLDIDTVLKAGERKALDVGYGNYIFDAEIQTILTKESYMANCYKVGGEDE